MIVGVGAGAGVEVTAGVEVSADVGVAATALGDGAAVGDPGVDAVGVPVAAQPATPAASTRTRDMRRGSIAATCLRMGPLDRTDERAAGRGGRAQTSHRDDTSCWSNADWLGDGQ